MKSTGDEKLRRAMDEKVSAEADRLLRETKQEKVTSFLMAAILVLGIIVAGLIAVLAATRLLVSQVPAGVEFLEIAGEEGATIEDEPLKGLSGVGPEEAEPLRTSTSVLDLLAEVATDPDRLLLNPEEELPGIGGDASGSGEKGSGPGSGVIPREQRWSIVHDPGESLGEYARKLDYFGIELAVALGIDKLLYVSDLSKPQLTKRVGPTSLEKRLYWAWRGTGRRDADLQLLQKAAVEVSDGIVVQFVPERVERTLAELERSYRNRRPQEIKSTQFGIRKTHFGYQFYVMAQKYRN